MIKSLTARASDNPEYRKAYNRGWQASARITDGALDRADRRGEPDAWYDGYHDEAAGRKKWHLLHCTTHGAGPCDAA